MGPEPYVGGRAITTEDLRPCSSCTKDGMQVLSGLKKPEN
jgi:hypothetical protein